MMHVNVNVEPVQFSLLLTYLLHCNLHYLLRATLRGAYAVVLNKCTYEYLLSYLDLHLHFIRIIRNLH